jgi:hypothetical protein
MVRVVASCVVVVTASLLNVQLAAVMGKIE